MNIRSVVIAVLSDFAHIRIKAYNKQSQCVHILLYD